jgi:hypothetical protein
MHSRRLLTSWSTRRSLCKRIDSRCENAEKHQLVVSLTDRHRIRRVHRIRMINSSSQVSGRALDSLENDESDRKHLCHRAVADQGHQGPRLTRSRDCHGLQADRRRTNPWRAVNAPHLVTLVRAGAIFHKGKLLERPIDITPAEPAESTETEVA